MKKNCPPPNPSCSSSSSSSCIDSPASTQNAETKKRSLQVQPRNKTNYKRVRAKKTEVSADNSATSSKSRSSIYRGVTRHRWTGRYEAHLWDKTTWNSVQNKRGRQIYLGAYDNEEDAARTYDLAALKYWGPTTILNFPEETYANDIEDMQKLSKEEFLASLRRRSSGFSRGVSKYRGVARHHHNGRWEARIGRVSGNKYLYLGTYSTQEEAAAAYDRAAIEFRGPNAVTNFDISNYVGNLKTIQLKQEEDEKPNHYQQDESQRVILSKLESIDLVVPSLNNKVQQIETVCCLDQEVVQPSIPKLELIDSVDSQAMDVVVMDPIEGQEHPWDLCLETTGFNSLAMPDIPLDRASEFLGFLDEKGFEDDIEYIFDGPFNGNEFVAGTVGGCKAEETEVLKVHDRRNSPSPSSSSLSTMTSN